MCCSLFSLAPPFFNSFRAMNSDDDYSDLTDIDSGEYEEKPKKKKGKSSVAAKEGGYRLKNVLKVPRATTYTTQALYGE